jgi:hypothetical protein
MTASLWSTLVVNGQFQDRIETVRVTEQSGLEPLTLAFGGIRKKGRKT